MSFWVYNKAAGYTKIFRRKDAITHTERSVRKGNVIENENSKKDAMQ
jgi:hypothetical protein